VKALRFLGIHLLAVTAACALVILADQLGGLYLHNFPLASHYKDYRDMREAHFMNWESRGAVNRVPEFFRQKKLIIFGSSDLWVQTAYLPSHFLAKKLGQDILSFGNGGNQSLTTLINLMDFHSQLDEKSRIVILLSPSWFHGRGLETHAFFDYIQPEALLRIRFDEDIPERFKMPVANYLARSSAQINGMVAEKFVYSAPISLAAPLFPIIEFFKVDIPEWLRERSQVYRALALSKPKPKNREPSSADFDWAQAFARARALVQRSTNNNEFGIDNEIWTDHLRGTVPRKMKHPKMDGREIEDLKALVDFLEYKKVPALFVMQPINRTVYTDADNFKPMSDKIAALMKTHSMAFVDFTTMPFEKAWMDDVLHMSDYGWLKMDEVIAKWFIAFR
jgi:D-alanyl-lipoteichoic acid biosynthesis protein DltD